jgi:hypothetical protein
MAPKKYGEDAEDIQSMSPKDVNRLQQLGATLFYYARAVDPTLIMPFNVLPSEKTRATADTAEKNNKLLNYCTTHPEETLRYHASGMILNIHSDASYLSEREIKSRAGDLFYIGSTTDNTNRLTNGAILIISIILKHIMSSAAEAEMGALTRRTGTSSTSNTFGN